MKELSSLLMIGLFVLASATAISTFRVVADLCEQYDLYLLQAGGP